MKIRPLVSLDLGSTKVACAIGLPHERAAGFTLLGSSLVPYPSYPDAWLSDPLMVSQTIEQALEATAVAGDVDRALVCLNHPALQSEHARVIITLGDEPITVRAQDVDRLRRSALDQTLSVDREPLLVERLGCSGNGFEGVRDPRGFAATRLLGTFHMLTMPISARRAVVQAVESAGLEVAQLTSSLSAVFAASIEQRSQPSRVLVIDQGGLTTDLGMFVEGLLHRCQVLPQGGLTLATAIAATRRVTMEQAVTWSLEGTSCRKPEARALIEEHWAKLQPVIERILADQPRPDAVLVTGRGALMDGFVEWVERMTGIRTSVARSARLNNMGDLSRQVGLSAAVGLLEMATHRSRSSPTRSPRFFNRLIDQTRAVLTEYF